MVTELQSSCLSTILTAFHSDVRQAMIRGITLSMLLRASITGDIELFSLVGFESYKFKGCRCSHVNMNLFTLCLLYNYIERRGTAGNLFDS